MNELKIILQVMMEVEPQTKNQKLTVSELWELIDFAEDYKQRIEEGGEVIAYQALIYSFQKAKENRE